MMSAGVAVGAMFATLCATTSRNERQSRFRPGGCSGTAARSSGIEYLVELREPSIEIGVVDDERRLDAQDFAVVAADAHQEAALEHEILHLFCALRVGRLALAVRHELDAEHEAKPADVA